MVVHFPMLKLACYLPLLFCFSGAFAKESPLCPKPTRVETSTFTTDPHILHEYMQKANDSAKHLDWIPDEKAQGACHGYYLEPQNPNAQKSVEQKKADTFISADTVSTEKNNTLLLSGNVEAYKGSTRLSCERMRYNQKTENADIQGHLTIRDAGFLLQADEGEITNRFKTIDLRNATYLIHKNQVRGKAAHLSINTKDGQEQLTLKEAMISSCPPHQDNWTLHASTIDLDNKEGAGSAYNAVIRIEDIPVFYFPYMTFPINDKRKTGFLFPNLSLSTNNIDIATPYYLNIAPQFDMTYTPRLQTEHTLGHGLEARYKNTWSEWQLNGEFVPNDKRVGDKSTQTLNKNDRNRWAYGLKESGQINRYFHTFINFQAVSDNDFFQDWGSQGLAINKTLNLRREAFLGFNANNWQIDTRLIDYQSLEDNPDPRTLYRQVPRIDVTYHNIIKPFTLTPTFHNQYVNFQHEQNRVESNRFFTEPGLSYHAFWPYAAIESAATYKRLDMFLEKNEDTSTHYITEGHQSLNIPTFSVDSNLVFERESTGFLQTLTPRLFYYYARYEKQDELPNFDTSESTFSYQQLFRGERFNGYDRISDANQVTLALSTELFSQQAGRLLGNVGIGQIFYAKDRRVALYAQDKKLRPIDPNMNKGEKDYLHALNDQINRRYYNSSSDIAAQINIYPTPKQTLTFNTLFDPHAGDFQESSVNYQYRHDNWQLVNLGFRYVKNLPLVLNKAGTPKYLIDDINEVDFSAIWPLAPQWSAIVRYQYDINRHEEADRIIGVAFDSCCLNIMLAYQRERKIFDVFEWERNNFHANYENQFLFEFTLKGLGTMSSTITKMLNEKFPGFRKK